MLSSCRNDSPVDCHRQKNAPTFQSRHVLALPIFTASHPATIVGANELNFCVRDGNRWTLIAINTHSYGWALAHLLSRCLFAVFRYSPHCSFWIVSNLFQFVNPFFVSSYQIKAQHRGFDLETTSHDTGEETFPNIFEQCVMCEELVTHTGFEPMLTAWEAAVLTTWPMGQFGAPSGTRTRDPLIKSQLLYQLS